MFSRMLSQKSSLKGSRMSVHFAAPTPAPGVHIVESNKAMSIETTLMESYSTTLSFCSVCAGCRDTAQSVKCSCPEIQQCVCDNLNDFCCETWDRGCAISLVGSECSKLETELRSWRSSCQSKYVLTDCRLHRLYRQRSRSQIVLVPGKKH